MGEFIRHTRGEGRSQEGDGERTELSLAVGLGLQGPCEELRGSCGGCELELEVSEVSKTEHKGLQPKTCSSDRFPSVNALKNTALCSAPEWLPL